MPKSPDAFRTISEVADWLDKPAHVLRFWESKFTQVKPVKRAGGRRYYRPDDMMLLGGIKKLLHDDGMTIKGVQKVLREQGIKYVTELSQPLDEISAAATGRMDDHGDVIDADGPYAGFESAEETTEEATVIAFQRTRDPAPAQDHDKPDAAHDHATSSAPHATDVPTPSMPDAGVTGVAPTDEPEEQAPASISPDTAQSAEEVQDARPAPANADAGTQVDDDRDAEPTADNEQEPTDADALPAFLRTSPPEPDAPSTPPEATLRPGPLVVDTPDIPEFDQIEASPGLLAAIVARRAPLSRSDRHSLSAARDDLAHLRRRMAQNTRD